MPLVVKISALIGEIGVFAAGCLLGGPLVGVDQTGEPQNGLSSLERLDEKASLPRFDAETRLVTLTFTFQGKERTSQDRNLEELRTEDIVVLDNGIPLLICRHLERIARHAVNLAELAAAGEE